MLDHVFISVSDVGRSIAFQERALVPLGNTPPSAAGQPHIR